MKESAFFLTSLLKSAAFTRISLVKLGARCCRMVAVYNNDNHNLSAISFAGPQPIQVFQGRSQATTWKWHNEA